MPTPFPGMDPWLEGPELFPDLHDTLIIYIREALNAAMPRGYAAIGSTLVWTEEAQRREPDVSLVRRDDEYPTGVATAVLPGLLTLGDDPAEEPVEQSYLEVRTTADRRLVTAIVILTPANKQPGEAGHGAYRAKQLEFRRAGVHVVEIDLLRAGAHVMAAPRGRLERAAGAFDYHVSVLVLGERPQVHAAGVRLADRLPAFGVPLDPGVPPATVDLQPMLGRAYDTGRYADLVDYARPCDPPLTAEQQAWAAGVLAGREGTTQRVE